MLEKITISLHGFNLELSVNPVDSWDFWRWKLDPFKVRSGINTKADAKVCLCLDQEQEIPDTTRMILKETQKIGFYTYSAFLDRSGDVFWVMDRPAKNQRVLSYRISREWNEICLVEDNSQTDGQLAFEILNRILPGAFLKKSIFQLHAALVEDQGRGILICADSGVGKTTHARLWRDHRRSIIIDGDRASCVKENNKWTAFGIPWCGTSGEFMNRSVPIHAVVLLERGKTNEVSRFEGIDSFFNVLPHLQYPGWNQEMIDIGTELLQEFVEEVPAVRLRCLPDTDAVDTLDRFLRKL